MAEGGEVLLVTGPESSVSLGVGSMLAVMVAEKSLGGMDGGLLVDLARSVERVKCVNAGQREKSPSRTLLLLLRVAWCC